MSTRAKKITKAVSPPGRTLEVPPLQEGHIRVASLIPAREWNDPSSDWSASNEMRLGILARSLLKMKGREPTIIACPAGFFQFDEVTPESAAQTIAESVSEMLLAVAPRTTVVTGLDVTSGRLEAQTVIAINKQGLQRQVYKLFPTQGRTKWGTDYFEPIDLSLATRTLKDRAMNIDGTTVVLAVCYDVYGLHGEAIAENRNNVLRRAAERGEVQIDLEAIQAELQSQTVWATVNPGLIINCVHDFDGGPGRFTTQWGNLCYASRSPLLAAAFYTDIGDANLLFCRKRDEKRDSGGAAVELAGDFWWYVDGQTGKDWVWVQCFDLPK